ncbi:MAG: hypothetical protein HY600_04025 [Candidatus Omnitrophica bacterium]|nr:hypothetical protein [Candidatus Omnitrophota bacterium]
MGHGVAVLLVSAAAGYWVLGQSEHQKAGVKKLGQYLGVAIILVSVIGAACKIYSIVTCYGGGMGKAAVCPMTGKPLPSTP